MAGYQWTLGNADAALLVRLMSVRSAPNPRPYLTCTYVSSVQRVQSIEKWFLTGNKNEADDIDFVIQIGWFQGLQQGYLPYQWNVLQALLFRTQGVDANCYTGERWTCQLIAFFWTQSHTLRKHEYVSAHAPSDDNSGRSSARSRQAAHQCIEMAYAYDPHTLAHDRRVLGISLEERYQSRTSDLVAWAKTTFSVIYQSIRDD
jgi:hypothetical protein